jgi:hypothetical protein
MQKTPRNSDEFGAFSVLSDRNSTKNKQINLESNYFRALKLQNTADTPRKNTPAHKQSQRGIKNAEHLRFWGNSGMTTTGKQKMQNSSQKKHRIAQIFLNFTRKGPGVVSERNGSTPG